MDEGRLEVVPVPPNSPEREPASSKSFSGYLDGNVNGLAEPLSSKVPIPPLKLNLYRAAVALRALLLAAFFRYRVLHPVSDAPWLWLTAVACELWLSLAWLGAQLPKLFPTNRVAHLDRLASRHDADDLPGVDVLVTAADAGREPPLATANTVLSVLAADYPAARLACYVSDDGADMLLFEALFEAARFARRWVPFCRRHAVEPRAPELYFARGVDYLRDRAAPSFVKERRAMKREYEEFKVRLNFLAAKARKVPEDGWVMSDGTPWPGNNTRDHPAMIQVLLGHPGDLDAEGHELPRLFYVSREKRPGFQHHKKAGALNALLRVSALLTNGAYALNLDYDHCVTNSGALREATCFLVDPLGGNRICFVQFPLRIVVDDDDDDRNMIRSSVFFDIDMKCFDGIQGPVYVGSGCCFNRKALYGFEPALAEDDDEDETTPVRWSWWRIRKVKERALRRTVSAVPSFLDSEDSDEEDEAGTMQRVQSYRAALERHFGQSPAFIASAFGRQWCSELTVVPGASLLRQAIHVVSCVFEEQTRWGKDIGWIYGPDGGGGGVVTTSFKMHARGWASAYCTPARAAFRTFTPSTPSEELAAASRRAVAAMGALLSQQCPVRAEGGGSRLRLLQRLAYVRCVAYPLASVPLTVYCALPAVCLLTDRSVFPDTVRYYDGVLLILLVSSVVATSVMEMRWSGVALRAWWRDQKFWAVAGTSACLAAVFQGVFRACTGIDVDFSADETTKARPSSPEEEDDDAPRSVRWSNLLIPPASLVLGNLAGAVVAVSYGVDHGYQSWGPVVAKLALAGWVVAHLQGFLRGLLARRERAPTIAVLWSVPFVTVLSLLWINVDSYSAPPARSKWQQQVL